MRNRILLIIATLVFVLFAIIEIAHITDVIGKMTPDWVLKMIDARTALIVVIASALIVLGVWADYFIERHRERSRKTSEQSSAPSAIGLLSLTLAENDPRIVVEFIEEREGQLFKKNKLRLINNGGSEALDVRIEDIALRAQKVCFPHVEGSISGSGGQAIFEPATAQYGPAIKPLLVSALMNEWNSYNDLRMEELLVPVTIRYTNFTRTFDYTTTCTLAFQAIAEGLRIFTNSEQQTVIFRDFNHNKESKKA